MPTFVDPVADTAEAYKGLRGLAHANRAFEDLADTYQGLVEVSGPPLRVFHLLRTTP